MAALSRPAKDSRFAERFELYVNGLELANAFSELIDPTTQRQRLEEERAFRKTLGKTDFPVDDDLINALADMTETGGISVGVDRLAMLMLGANDIREVIAFPTDSMYSSNA
jgi:lysyl-tRNA synthetase class 2